MTDIVGGAVEKARGLAAQNGYTSVKSTLCYGVQWDAAMNFIDPNYITNKVEDPTAYVRNSTAKGNYNEPQNTNGWKNKITTTGASLNYQVKNIYDLAGNVYEWTMESRHMSVRVDRGGGYSGAGSYPASNRSMNSPTFSNSAIGFRPTLYL